MSAVDDAHERAAALIKDVEPRLASILTEEDAKVQLIIRFLTEVLGWSHAEISAERKNDNGYSDYRVPRTIPISVTSAPAEFRIELG